MARKREVTVTAAGISLDRHDGFRLALERREAISGRLAQCRADIARLRATVRSPEALDRAADAVLAGHDDGEMKANLHKLREAEEALPILELAAEKAAEAVEAAKRAASLQAMQEATPRHLDLVAKQRRALEALRDTLRDEVAFRAEFLDAGIGWRYGAPCFTATTGGIAGGIQQLDTLLVEIGEYLGSAPQADAAEHDHFAEVAP